MDVIKFNPSSFTERFKYSFALIKVAVKLILHGETTLVIVNFGEMRKALEGSAGGKGDKHAG